MANLKRYCPACLDKWVHPTVWDITKKKWIPRPTMHPRCREILEEIHSGRSDASRAS